MWIIVFGHGCGVECAPDYEWVGPFSSEDEAEQWNKDHNDRGRTEKLCDPSDKDAWWYKEVPR